MKKIARQIRNTLTNAKIAFKYNGSFKRKVQFYKFATLLRKKGVANFRIERVADLYVKDFFDYKGSSLEQKKWAYNHGFSSYKMAPWYGITTENYKDYVSDFDFYASRSFIKNVEINAWFDNKLSTYYILSPFKNCMPMHYFFLDDGRIMPIDYDIKKDANVEDVVSLIKEKPIAAKVCHGGHGVGFYKFSHDGHDFMINEKKSSKEDLVKCISSLNDYIITDFCKPHDSIIDLCGENTFAVLRMISVFDKTDGPQITCAAIRLGCKVAGITTDHEGTIYCGLTLDKGVFFNPLYRVADNRYDPIQKHPDTNKIIEGFVLPNFSELKVLVKKVSAYLPMTPYLVMDIIPTQNGFSILEINSHGQVGNVESFYPFCANKYNRKVFGID